ncbi:MAG: hypothetical protein ABA06_01500 [Parcubacteria bacterium C7867-001]|nr:MAG: hypothetical protein ABA06_01500 [Parcubacteria bacterium C7867-001]
MEKEYAHAIARSLTAGADEKKLFDGLMRHLKSVGRVKLLPRILRELKRDLVRASAHAPHVEAASEDDAAAAKKAAASVGIAVKKVEVNPSLIMGWRARLGSSLVDVSAKRALIDIYRNITN